MQVITLDYLDLHKGLRLVFSSWKKCSSNFEHFIFYLLESDPPHLPSPPATPEKWQPASLYPSFGKCRGKELYVKLGSSIMIFCALQQ